MKKSEKFYGERDLQNLMIAEIHQPLKDSLNILMSPSKSPLAKIRAINRLRKLVKVINEIPEPTKDRTHFPNTHVLIELRDWFFGHDTNEAYREIYRAIWNLAIIKYEVDPQIQRRINLLLKEWQKKPWEERGKEDINTPFWKA